MSLYFTDEIEIIPVTRDPTYSFETEGTPIVSKAYVEDERSLERTALGTEPNQGCFIFVPRNTQVLEGDYIRITKLHSVTIIPNSYTGKKLKVIRAYYVGAYKNSHIEIECNSGV